MRKARATNHLAFFLPFRNLKIFWMIWELEDIKAADAFETREDKEFVPFRQALDEIRNGLIK
jgi:hypothetical protein